MPPKASAVCFFVHENFTGRSGGGEPRERAVGGATLIRRVRRYARCVSLYAANLQRDARDASLRAPRNLADLPASQSPCESRLETLGGEELGEGVGDVGFVFAPFGGGAAHG